MLIFEGKVVKSKLVGLIIVDEINKEVCLTNIHGDSDGGLHWQINGKSFKTDLETIYERVITTIKRMGYNDIKHLVLFPCHPRQCKDLNFVIPTMNGEHTSVAKENTFIYGDDNKNAHYTYVGYTNKEKTEAATIVDKDKGIVKSMFSEIFKKFYNIESCYSGSTL